MTNLAKNYFQVHIEACHLPVSDAERFGRYVIANHQQVVVNLLSYDPEDAAQVMMGTITGMREWEEERANERRVAIMTFLTEAHKWFPQQMQENQLPADLYATFSSIFFADLVRRGRKRGMGLIFDTQKLQEIDKRILQPDWKVCLRQTEDRSLARYKQWGITPEEAMTLKNGEGFIFSSRVHKLRTQMDRRRSPDDSKSPGIDSIRRHRPEPDDELWVPSSLSPQRNTTLLEREAGESLPPIAKPQRVNRKAQLIDAIEIWNELGGVGRPRLQSELQGRGLECSDDLAKNLLRSIKQQLEGNAGGGGGTDEV